jgi:PLP dependent protein
VAARARPKGAGLKADAVRSAYERILAEAGPNVTVVAATKYVPVEEMSVLADAGVEVVGENRAQDLQAKHDRYADRFRWHFIGHLQSNKAKVVNRLCELVHSLDSDSSARRLTVPALLEVNLSGEPSKSGVEPGDVPAFLEAHAGVVRGLMTMPPFVEDPEASRPWFRRLRELAAEHGLRELSMGTSQDWQVAVEEGATYVRLGSALWDEPVDAGS